ncbi:MAG: SGNH/GDSL hydrolase family protein, partial [Chloroflexota bacterium]
MINRNVQKIKASRLVIGGLLMIGAIFLLFWSSTYGPQENLLTESGFESAALSTWQLVQIGEATATVQPSAGELPDNVLLFTLPDAAQDNWVGAGQEVIVTPLQRYRLSLPYHLLTMNQDQSSATIVLRISEFDQSGQLLEETEVSTPHPLEGTGDQESAWNEFSYDFFARDQTKTIQVGFGLFGRQATAVEFDNVSLLLAPTWLQTIRQDTVASLVLGLLGLLSLIFLIQALWPYRRKVLINGALGIVSLLVTLVLVEGVVRLIPINLVSPNWPRGYHTTFVDGSGYRLAKNVEPTIITDAKGDDHLVMSNALGLRDVAVPTDERPLLLVLGDSMTFGWAVSDVNDSWPRLLNTEIMGSPSIDNYHLINAGVSGYNTFQEVDLFEEVVADMAVDGQVPDVALLSFFSGIWDRNGFGAEGRFTVLNDAIMYSLVKEQLLNLPGRLVWEGPIDDLKYISPTTLNAPHQTILHNSRLYFILSILILNQLENNWDPEMAVDFRALNYEALQAFRDEAVAHGIQPIVAYLPADNLFTPSKLEKNQRIVDELSTICQEL